MSRAHPGETPAKTRCKQAGIFSGEPPQSGNRKLHVCRCNNYVTVSRRNIQAHTDEEGSTGRIRRSRNAMLTVDF